MPDSRMKLSAIREVEVITGDVDTVAYKTNDRYGTRITISSDGVGAGTINTQGSADGVNWYDLGIAFPVAAGETRTRWIGEPNTYLRVQATGVTGDLSFGVQEAS